MGKQQEVKPKPQPKITVSRLTMMIGHGQDQSKGGKPDQTNRGREK
jgi:hypothetical protein